MHYFLYRLYGEKKFSGKARTEDGKIVETTPALKRYNGKKLSDLLRWASMFDISVAVRATEDDQWHRITPSVSDGY